MCLSFDTPPISSRNYIHRIVGLLCLDKYDLAHGINLKTICL